MTTDFLLPEELDAEGEDAPAEELDAPAEELDPEERKALEARLVELRIALNRARMLGAKSSLRGKIREVQSRLRGGMVEREVAAWLKKRTTSTKGAFDLDTAQAAMKYLPGWTFTPAPAARRTDKPEYNLHQFGLFVDREDGTYGFEKTEVGDVVVYWSPYGWNTVTIEFVGADARQGQVTTVTVGSPEEVSFVQQGRRFQWKPNPPLDLSGPAQARTIAQTIIELMDREGRLPFAVKRIVVVVPIHPYASDDGFHLGVAAPAAQEAFLSVVEGLTTVLTGKGEPANPEAGMVYIHGSVRHPKPPFWLGVEGVQITAPNGDTETFPLPKDGSNDRLWKWVYARGLKAQAEATVDAATKAIPPARTVAVNRMTCPVCFRAVGTAGRSHFIALHGYRFPGHRYRADSGCPGAGHLAWEASPNGAIAYLMDYLLPYYTSLSEITAKYQRGEVKSYGVWVQVKGGGEGKYVIEQVTPTDPRWASVVQRTWAAHVDTLRPLWVPPNRFRSIPWYQTAIQNWKRADQRVGAPRIGLSDIPEDVRREADRVGLEIDALSEVPPPMLRPPDAGPLPATLAFIGWTQGNCDTQPGEPLDGEDGAPTYAEVCAAIEQYPEVADDAIRDLLASIG